VIVSIIESSFYPTGNWWCQNAWVNATASNPSASKRFCLDSDYFSRWSPAWLVKELTVFTLIYSSFTMFFTTSLFVRPHMVDYAFDMILSKRQQVG
jgi:hypothetical protein